MLWLNGEVVTKTLARRVLSLLPGTRVLNVYSCSETHEVAAGELRELAESPRSTYCPVGRPMDPSRLYILDRERREVPVGEAGELFVGGDCLARGYLGLPEKTEESFPPDPFSPAEDARMYRTGDKARILSDGNLEILGRTDFMVKIRGYSVELGAVEAAIGDRLAVRACVVIADGEEGTDKRLVAYLVPASEDERGERYAGWNLDPRTGRSSEIRHHLQDSLPHYAIPATFVEVEGLPLHEVSGKVDRARLPDPPARITKTSDPEEPVRKLPADASRSEKEYLLARAWEEVLRLERDEVRLDDNFFDLGGHSLAAAQLSSRVEEAFGVHVSMGSFLEDPTVGGLCDRIEALQRDGHGERPSRPDLRAEAALDPEIVPQGDGVPLSEAGGVFLTGATGFLGAFLLDALLRETQAEVHCLVRPREDPSVPIHENLRRYGRWWSEAERRVVPVAGDLGEPLFGMTEEAFGELAREVDVVIHAGAVVNLIYPYEALALANVGGTREVLRLACLNGTKPVHHVSTNGIFPAGQGLCEEDVDLDALADAREDGYGQSKWVAEKLVREAGGRGLPVRVYRPGNISGHSVTGASNPRDFLGALIAESLRIGAAPELEGWHMEMTPVDFVAGTICHLASDPEASGSVFHLANPDPPAASEIFSCFEDLGYRLERLPYPEWLAAQRQSSRRDDDVGGVLGGTSTGEHEIWDGNLYDDRNTRRALEGSGLERPVTDGALLERYARDFAQQGLAEPPPALTGERRSPA